MTIVTSLALANESTSLSSLFPFPHPSMRLAIFTDIHANFIALDAILADIRTEGCDLAYHLGDAIAIGPQPAECLARLTQEAEVICIKGNHDILFCQGLPPLRPGYMDEEEYQHQEWTHRQLQEADRHIVDAWPEVVQVRAHGVELVLLHYALDPRSNSFKHILRKPRVSDLNQLFIEVSADIIAFGHDHDWVDLIGRGHYLNPGSAGCQPSPVAPYTILDIGRNGYALHHRRVLYDDRSLFTIFEERQVPSRSFIYQAFFGNRYPP